MKLLVVGNQGSIGKRREGILADMGHKVSGIDAKNNSYLTTAKAKEFDAVFLCTPPNTLVDEARTCVDAKTPFFLEKPGAVNYREFVNLCGKVEKNPVINMVSCNLRFTTEYRAIQESLLNIGKPVFAYAEFGYFLPWWREGQYRTYYSCYRMAGGGVLMDAIHELDYMFSLFGPQKDLVLMAGKNDNTKELSELDAEDTSSMFFVYRNGMSMAVHLDYLQRAYKRVFHCVGTKGRIDQTFNVSGANQMYRSEMGHFLDCVKKNATTVKDVASHASILELIDRIGNNENSHDNPSQG